MTLASPPALSAAIPWSFLVLACIAGSIVVLGFGVAGFVEHDRDAEERFIACVVTCALFMALAAPAFPALRRLWRFADQPVLIDLKGTIVTLLAPHQWGNRPRTVDVTRIHSVKIRRGGGTLLDGIREFRIIFRRGTLWSRTIVHVAAADRAVLERAVADLRRAITFAQKRSESTVAQRSDMITPSNHDRADSRQPPADRRPL